MVPKLVVVVLDRTWASAVGVKVWVVGPGGWVWLATATPANDAASLPATSWTGFVAGAVYDSVTLSVSMTGEARVRVTIEPAIATLVTFRALPLTSGAYA